MTDGLMEYCTVETVQLFVILSNLLDVCMYVLGYMNLGIHESYERKNFPTENSSTENILQKTNKRKILEIKVKEHKY